MTDVTELRVREEELEREWTWLNSAINQVARALADREDARAFQLLQRQIIAVGQRRVELMVRISELESRGA